MQKVDKEVLHRFLVYHFRETVDNGVKRIADWDKERRSNDEQHRFEERVRYELENLLIPQILAVACVSSDAGADVLNKTIPRLIDESLTILPKDAEFLTNASKKVDLERWEIIEENLKPRGKSLARESFDAELTSIFSILDGNSREIIVHQLTPEELDLTEAQMDELKRLHEGLFGETE